MQMIKLDLVHRPHEFHGPDVGRMPPMEIAALQHSTQNEQFLAMLRSFRRSGGLARGHDVASLLASRSGLNIGNLARWIVEDEVVHFDWQCDSWFPMFQFGGPDMTPRPGVSRVLKELRGVFEPWDTAQWFARPCAALAGMTPADAMPLDPEKVWRAARCDRFVVDA
jgi:hypothetical protein